MSRRRTPQKYYALHQCALYKLRSKGRLCTLLQTKPEFLKSLLAHGDSNYLTFTIRPNGRKARDVQHPKNNLEKVHARLFDLLRRIEPPDYLHSGIKKRSYVTNAKSHVGSVSSAKIDIKSFYPSTTYRHIRQFYIRTLECSPDVATILTKLSTVDDHVPTGSCLSQILTFYCHKEMFDKIYQLAVENDVRMTCYVDDLTFSGDAVNSAFMFEVKKIIHHRGLKYHKECTFNATDPKLVTGVIVKQEQILVPNKLQLAISHGIENISSASPDEIRSLAGKCNAAAQIEPRFLSLARYVRKFLT